jgi:hypothetical protein
MELITILNRCYRFRGFVYKHARFSPDHKSIEVAVRPRKGSAAICSRCHQPAPGYDQLTERRFEFIPLWGFFVFLLYAMRRVDCRRCGAVLVEEVPWSDGKRSLTKAYMLFLARWARRLSWKETAAAFHTSWEKVFDAVEHVVTWGLEQSDECPDQLGEKRALVAPACDQAPERWRQLDHAPPEVGELGRDQDVLTPKIPFNAVGAARGRMLPVETISERLVDVVPRNIAQAPAREDLASCR